MKESQGHRSGGCSQGGSQSGQQSSKETADMEMVGMRKGRNGQDLKMGVYAEGKYMKSSPAPLSPKSRIQAAWQGKISESS